MTSAERVRFRINKDTMLIVDGEMLIVVSTTLTPQTQLCHLELVRVDVKPDGDDWNVTVRTHGKYSEPPLVKFGIAGPRIPAFQQFIAYAKEISAWSLSQDQLQP